MDFHFVYLLTVRGSDGAWFFNTPSEAFDYADEKGYEFYDVEVFKSYD